MKEILVGSNAFFKGIKEFHSKDKDYLILVDEPTDFKIRKEICLRGIDKFYYKKDIPQNMMQTTLSLNDPMLIGKFLVKEVAHEIGLSPQDILILEPLLEKLDEQHQYQKIIFKYIIENNSFELTDEQLKEAYQSYLESRNSKSRQ